MPNNRPRYGNCLLGAIWLKVVYGGRIKGLRLKTGGPRHWVTKLPDGSVWHFRRVKDVWPYPLCLIAFWGILERLEGKRSASQ